MMPFSWREKLSSVPLGAEEFCYQMQRLGLDAWPSELAVAVSGGPDSMALALLLREWCSASGKKLLALTVDHGLRPESADEAGHVASWLSRHGLACEVLHWTGDKPGSRIEERAREARYDLLSKACARHGITHLFLAHHAQDQAETVLMRFAAGSGVDGLAGMAPVSLMAGLTLLRPLLDVPPGRLRATCRAHGQAWIEDPMNASQDFARARLRKNVPSLAREGLTAIRLVRLSKRAARMRDAVAFFAEEAWGRLAVVQDGEVLIDQAGLVALPGEIRLRLVQRAILSLHPEAKLRQHRIEALLDALEVPDFRRRTLGGCILSRRKGKLVVRDEKLASQGQSV